MSTLDRQVANVLRDGRSRTADELRRTVNAGKWFWDHIPANDFLAAMRWLAALRVVKVVSDGGIERYFAADATNLPSRKYDAQEERAKVVKEYGLDVGSKWIHHSGEVAVILAVAVRQQDLVVEVVYSYPSTGNVWSHELRHFLFDDAGNRSGRFVPYA